MFTLVKLVLAIALVALLAWVTVTVPIGHYTFAQHVRRIWRTEETQDLVRSTKETAAPALERVSRGVSEAQKPAHKTP